MDSEINPYVEALYFMSQSEISVEDGYFRRDEIIPTIAEKVENLSANYEISDLVDVHSISNSIFDKLAEAKVFLVDSPKFAGDYYVFRPVKYKEFRDSFNGRDGIASTATRIGSRFFPDVFDGIRSAVAGIPAADRYVRLDHNNPQLIEIFEKISELESQLRSGNDVGSLDEDGVEAAISEVAELRSSLERPVVRKDAIRIRTVGTLTWIGKEAAGGLIGAAALALLALIASFFGFGF